MANTAQIMMRCPQVDKCVPTGVEVDAGSFVEAQFADNQSSCPQCGEMHRWGDAEIVLAN